MKKYLHIILEDEEIIELYHALIDDDAAAILKLLKRHLKSEISRVLEGG